MRKPGPSSMILVCSIYQTLTNWKQSRMFETNLSTKLHEIKSIKCGSDVSCLSNTAQ